MLRFGPPQIWTAGVPLREREFANEGWVTRIGTGEATFTMAAMATAFTVVVEVPNNPSKVVRTLRCTVTRISAVGSVVEKFTPATVEVAGKSTVTVSLDEEPK